jgi:hypothetical protein
VRYAPMLSIPSHLATSPSPSGPMRWLPPRFTVKFSCISQLPHARGYVCFPSLATKLNSHSL